MQINNIAFRLCRLNLDEILNILEEDDTDVEVIVEQGFPNFIFLRTP